MNVVGVILAAGFGTRLRPSTERCPKPLIPVGGIEPLFFALHRAYELGIRRVVVNSHYLPEKIDSAVKRWAPLFHGLEIRISKEEPEILGTGGGLIKIVKDNPDWFKNSGLLLQNGDTLAQIKIERLLAKPDECSFAVSFLEEHLKRYNPLWVDERGDWAGIGKMAPVSNAKAAHFLGVHYLSPAAVKELSTDAFEAASSDLFNAIYRPLANQGYRFRSHVCMDCASQESFWFDMTSSDFLLEAQRHVLESLRSTQLWSKILEKRYPGIQELEPGVWVLTKQHSAARHFYSPVIMVDAPSSPADCAVGKLSLGPHASLIHEQGAFRIKSEEAERKISNAVVLINGSSKDEIPQDVHDQVCVL